MGAILGMIPVIIYESHSTSEDNEKGIASGHLDPRLSVRGQNQAREMGSRYLNCLPDLVLSSDLKRSYETAKIAFPNITRIETPLLREWNYGSYNGRSTAEVEGVKSHYIRKSFPEGESLEDAVTRILAFIDLQKERAQRIMIIGHRSTYYALEHRYNNRLLEEIVYSPWSWQPGWQYPFQYKNEG